MAKYSNKMRKYGEEGEEKRNIDVVYGVICVVVLVLTLITCLKE